MRSLVAGFGNELRGDDGFGVAVLQRLEAVIPPSGDVSLVVIGTAGIRLAQELIAGYDRVIVVDAMHRGGEVGTLYALHIDAVDTIERIDLHLAVPAKALALAKAVGVLPPEVYMVGCEAAEVDELTMDLTPSVREAVAAAVAQVCALLALPPADAGVLPVAASGGDANA